MKKIKLMECIKDIKNGVVKRKINKNKKNKIINIYNVMGYRKWCRQEKRKKFLK